MAKYIQLLKYKDFFDEPLPEREDFLKGIPKKAILLLLIKWINDNKIMAGELETKSKIQISLLATVLKNSNHPAIDKLNIYRAQGKQKGFLMLWITPHTCLHLIEYLLSNHSRILFDNEKFVIEEASNELKNLNKDQLLDIVKVYLSFAQERSKKLKNSINDKFQKVIKSQFTEQIGIHELERNDDQMIFYVEFIKAIEFFEFLESNYKDLLSCFLETKDLNYWQEYVLKITGFMNIFNVENRVRVESGLEKQRDIQFFNNLVSPDGYKSMFKF